MTARHSDIQQRKDRILEIVIGRYIKTVLPVGSQYITEEHEIDVSPATVRNILADLEEEGYLTHPHTSAGRMPTQQGYRYYVDHLMHEIQLLEEEKRRISQEYKRHVNQLEDLMEKTSQVISDLTHYTSIVSLDDGEGHQHKIICKGTNYVVGYPESTDILKMQAILKILEEKERLMELINRSLETKIKIYIGHEMALKDMESCSLAISHFEKDGVKGRIAVLGPTRMQYDRVVSTLEYISQILSR
jgi:transcriptional regulator of heat shock response